MKAKTETILIVSIVGALLMWWGLSTGNAAGRKEYALELQKSCEELYTPTRATNSYYYECATGTIDDAADYSPVPQANDGLE